MTQEEKAQRYDEAIKRVEDIKTGKCETTFMFTEDLFEYIFPELKESEGESIRKELLNYLYDVHDDDEERARWIAWLENQGEHAKFRDSIQVGDKVTRNRDGMLVNLSQLKRVAKPADNVEPSIFKDRLLELFQIFRWRCKDHILTNGEILEYVDAHIQELIGTMQKPADTKKGAKGNDREIPISEPPLTIKHAREVMGIKQDTAWSEVDDVKINRIVACLENLNVAYNDILLKDVAWLKSLKERYAWKPSDEQIIELRRVISGCSYDIEPLAEMEEQLKKLREE